jgi:DNA-3-methyladenine glycosylase
MKIAKLKIKNSQRLPRAFYTRNTHVVAKDLLGKILVRRWRGRTIRARITEVESYVGEDDRASHARFGKTMRTTVMYGKAGHAYVFLVYGMYNCLNIVTEDVNFPAAVLIRGAVEMESGIGNKESGLFNGPGKLTRALHITRALNGEDLVRSKKLYVVDDGHRVPKKNVLTSPRIGVDYAGEHALLPWRYFISAENKNRPGKN